MNGRMAPKGITTHSKAAPGDDRRPNGPIKGVRNAPRRFSACVVIGLLLGIGGLAYAGEPPSFKRVARVTLQQRHVEERDDMALTLDYWLGVTGAFGAGANWSDGNPPGGDRIGVFDGTSQTSVTSDLDYSAVLIKQLLVKPEYTGQIGSQGNPLRLQIDTGGVLVWRGGGQGYINLKNGNFGNVIVDTPNVLSGSRYNLVLGGMGATTQGNVAVCAVKRGNVLYMGDLNSSGNIYVTGDAARLVVDAALGGITELGNVICNAGEFINRRSFGASVFVIAGDSARVEQVGALLATTHVVVIGNGKFVYLPTTAPGTSPLLSVMGGLYDMSEERFDNVWGTTIIGPGAFIKGGVVRGTNIFPASFDLREEYPGPQE